MKPSELTGAELAAMVAEGMGAVWISVPKRGGYEKKGAWGGYWQFPDGAVIEYWHPCNRADHWWKVVEWMEREHGLGEFVGALARLIDYHHKGRDWYLDKALIWFLAQKRPGRTVCEAFVEVFCEVG